MILMGEVSVTSASQTAGLKYRSLFYTSEYRIQIKALKVSPSPNLLTKCSIKLGGLNLRGLIIY